MKWLWIVMIVSVEQSVKAFLLSWQIEIHCIVHISKYTQTCLFERTVTSEVRYHKTNAAEYQYCTGFGLSTFSYQRGKV